MPRMLSFLFVLLQGMQLPLFCVSKCRGYTPLCAVMPGAHPIFCVEILGVHPFLCLDA